MALPTIRQAIRADRPHTSNGTETAATTTDLHSLTRTELIVLIQSERKARRVAPLVFNPQDKDALINVLNNRLRASEQYTAELERTIRELREELSVLSSRSSTSTRRSSSPPPPVPQVPPGVYTPPKSAASSSSSNSNLFGFNRSRKQSCTSTVASSVRSNDPDKEVIAQLTNLNNTIASTATQLSRTLQYNDLLVTVPDRRKIDGLQQSMARSSWVVGGAIANELAAKPLPVDALTDSSPPSLLAQMVFEMVFTKWCAFALGYVDNQLSNAGADAYHWCRTVYNLRFTPTKYEFWVTSVMNCIRDITYVAGWALKTESERGPTVSLIPLITAVQSLRKALDEASSAAKIIDIQVISPGSTYTLGTKSMTDAYAVGKRTLFGVKRRPSTSGDRVAATTGLGLKTWAQGETADQIQTMVPPRVLLDRAFLDAFSKSAQLEQPKVRVRVGGGRSSAIAPVRAKADE